MIRLPPDENGLIALLCAPRTVQAKSASGLRPVDAASAGINGKSAGATTPVVEEKKLMKAATMLKAIGTIATATLEPIHSFCGANFIIKAITAKTIPTSPTSILLLSAAIVLFAGRMLFSIGKASSTIIAERLDGLQVLVRLIG